MAVAEGVGRGASPPAAADLCLLARRGGGLCQAPPIARSLRTAEQVRLLEARAAQAGTSPLRLMRRAGRAAWRLTQRLWPQRLPGERQMLVLCGKGNNGGDGYMVAALAARGGWRVRLAAPLGGPSTAESRQCAEWAAESGVQMLPPGMEPCLQELQSGQERDRQGNWQPGGVAPRLLVDALLGAGLTRGVQGQLAQVLRGMEGAPVLALDVPSGLDADLGSAQGEAVRATATLTFIAAKPGLCTGLGRDCVGDLYLADLGLGELLAGQDALPQLLDQAGVLAQVPRFPPASHKGSRGRAVVLGGCADYPGAPALAALAALRCGAGLVAAVAESTEAVAALVPEAILTPVPPLGTDQAGQASQASQTSQTDQASQAGHAGQGGQSDWDQALPDGAALVLGPGLGRGEFGQALCAAALHRLAGQGKTRMVLDADGLALWPGCVGDIEAWRAAVLGRLVITPHPKEAAALLGCTTRQVQRDRQSAARELAALTGAAVVLKGAGSLIAAPQDWPHAPHAGALRVCTGGSPVLATGGTGDVLAGAIGGLLAQGMEPFAAACTAVVAHAEAGDREAARAGQGGLAASDLCAQMRLLLHPPGTSP